MIDSARIEELKRRVQLDPASIAFAALAEEYRRGGQYEEAIAVCQAGLQRHPAYLSARVTLGRSFLELSRFDEAREQLEEVLRSAPENLAAIRALAEIHDRVGEYPDPPERVNPARSEEPRPAPGARFAPVPLSRGTAAPAPPSTPANAPAPESPPPAAAAPIRPLTPARTAAPLALPPPPRVPHPDEAALPALEAFLTAIRAAKTAGRPPFD
jgi:tetratricopeptide (TPR) repeat protein